MVDQILVTRTQNFLRSNYGYPHHLHIVGVLTIICRVIQVDWSLVWHFSFVCLGVPSHVVIVYKPLNLS